MISSKAIKSAISVIKSCAMVIMTNTMVSLGDNKSSACYMRRFLNKRRAGKRKQNLKSSGNYFMNANVKGNKMGNSDLD